VDARLDHASGFRGAAIAGVADGVRRCVTGCTLGEEKGISPIMGEAGSERGGTWQARYPDQIDPSILDLSPFPRPCSMPRRMAPDEGNNRGGRVPEYAIGKVRHAKDQYRVREVSAMSYRDGEGSHSDRRRRGTRVHTLLRIVRICVWPMVLTHAARALGASGISDMAHTRTVWLRKPVARLRQLPEANRPWRCQERGFGSAGKKCSATK
jgi:hypothetical protein